jgi:hypothetical protein
VDQLEVLTEDLLRHLVLHQKAEELVEQTIKRLVLLVVQEEEHLLAKVDLPMLAILVVITQQLVVAVVAAEVELAAVEEMVEKTHQISLEVEEMVYQILFLDQALHTLEAVAQADKAFLILADTLVLEAQAAEELEVSMEELWVQ